MDSTTPLQPSFSNHSNSTLPSTTQSSTLSTIFSSILQTLASTISSRMSAIISTPSTMSSTISAPLSANLSTPSTMASTISSLSTIFTTPSNTSPLPPPSFMSTIPTTLYSLATPSSMSTMLSTPGSMASMLPTPSTMSTISGSLSYNRTIDCPSHEEALRVPLAVFYSLLFVVGLTANLLALWVFLFLRRRWDSMHILLVNSAVSDLLLLTSLPFRVYYHTNGNHWHLGAMACGLVTSVFYINMYINIAMLGLIGLGRYAWLRRRGGSSGGTTRCVPGRSPCGVPWTWVVCGLVWGLELAMSGYVIAKWTQKDEDKKCFQFIRWDETGRVASIKVALEVMFWLVFVVLGVSYGKIAISQHGRRARKSLFVLVLFTVCFVPYHIFRPFYIRSQLHQSDYTEDDLCRMQQIHQVMVCFSAFNSCVDPVMYFFLSGSMRKLAARVL